MKRVFLTIESYLYAGTYSVSSSSIYIFLLFFHLIMWTFLLPFAIATF